MRIAILVLFAATIGMTGASCIPGIDLDAEQNQPVPARKLAATLLLPDISRTVTQGELVRVRWTAANKTGGDAVLDLVVRSRSDDAETILLGGERVSVTGTTQDLLWDTSTFQGPYDLNLRITSGTDVNEFRSTAVITINESPSFVFTAPTDPVSIEVGGETDPSVPISFTSFDRDGDGNAVIRLDTDENHDSGNEVTLTERDLPETRTDETFTWNGKDSASADVEAGEYFLFAEVTDARNADQVIEGLAKITVTAAPEPLTLAITAPDEDTEFLLGTTTSLQINYSFAAGREADVLIDLKLDRDDNNTNGNEVTILSQRLIDPDTETDFFDWFGTDVNGGPIFSGIYRVLLTQSTGSGTPTIVAADGRVLFRDADEQPLISLLEPATDQTLTAGSFLTIRWRDDDPAGTSTVRLFLDDDANPAEPTETDTAEMEILNSRSAGPDDVQDTFQFQVPSTLAPGTYFIFAYVDRDNTAPFEVSSVAAGRLIIRDPSNP